MAGVEVQLRCSLQGGTGAGGARGRSVVAHAHEGARAKQERKTAEPVDAEEGDERGKGVGEVDAEGAKQGGAR